MASFPDLTVQVRTQAEAERERLEAEAWRIWQPIMLDLVGNLQAEAQRCSREWDAISDVFGRIGFALMGEDWPGAKPSANYPPHSGSYPEPDDVTSDTAPLPPRKIPVSRRRWNG